MTGKISQIFDPEHLTDDLAVLVDTLGLKNISSKSCILITFIKCLGQDIMGEIWNAISTPMRLHESLQTAESRHQSGFWGSSLLRSLSED